MSPVTTSKTGGCARNEKIDFLRFVFAVIIVLHHTRYLLGDEHCLFLGGSLGVEFFFIVSGYLMMASFKRRPIEPKPLGRNTLRFLYRKVKSIYPEFFIAWWIGFFFVVFAEHYTLRGMVRLFVNDFFELTLLKMSGLFVSGIDGVIWYISAMLLVMAVLYPLLLSYPDMYSRIIAPLLCLFIMGFFMQTSGHPRNPTGWCLVVYKGVLRAAAEISLGVFLYGIAEKMSKMKWTFLSRLVFTALEIAGYLSVILYMALRDPSKDDFFFIAVLAMAITISFAGVSLWKGALPKGVVLHLAKLSVTLYFSHLYYAQHLNSILPESLSPAARVALYLLLSILTAEAVLFLAGALRKKAPEVKRIFITE